MNLYNIYKKNKAIENIRAAVTPYLQSGGNRNTALRLATEKAQLLNADITAEEIAAAIPDISSGNYMGRVITEGIPGGGSGVVGDTVTNTATHPMVARGLVGAGIGSVIGSPRQRRLDVERIVGEAPTNTGAIATKLKTLEDLNSNIAANTAKITKLQEKLNKIKPLKPLTRAQQRDPQLVAAWNDKKLRQDNYKAKVNALVATNTTAINKYKTDSKGIADLRSDVDTINKFVDQRKGTPHVVASRNWRKPWKGSGWGTRPQLPFTPKTVNTSPGVHEPINAVYKRVSSQIPNKPRHSVRGAIQGAAIASLLPDLVRAAKGLFFSNPIDDTALTTALEGIKTK